MFSRNKTTRPPGRIQQARALAKAVGVSLYGAEGVALAVVVIRRREGASDTVRPLPHARPDLGA